MLPEVRDDGEAKRRFVDQIDELSPLSKLRGPAPDGAASLAAIVAENEAECLRMEEDTSEQDASDAPRPRPSSS